MTRTVLPAESSEHRVRVRWSSEKRRSLPASNCYSTVSDIVSFEDGKLTNWSVLITFDDESQADEIRTGTLAFLSPDGPWDQLAKGKIIKLYEGRTISAEVEII